MTTKIKKDFQPDDNSYALVAKHGAIREFVDDQYDHFISYWLETGKTKASWQSTWQVWMRRAWQGKCGREWETSRHYRTQGASDGNPFEKVLANLKPGETPPLQHHPEKPQRPYKRPAHAPRPIAAGGAPMTSEQAFAQLRQSGFLK